MQGSGSAWATGCKEGFSTWRFGFGVFTLKGLGLTVSEAGIHPKP